MPPDSPEVILRIRRSLPALLAAGLAAGSLAFAPAPEGGSASGEATVVAEGDGEEEAPELYEPCADSGATTITPAEGFDGTVPTPVGGPFTTEVGATDRSDAGTYQLDLAGFEVGTTGRFTFTLDWDTPGGLGDYDLYVNGQSELPVDKPETVLLTAAHCQLVDLEVQVFTGTPLDTLTLDVSARTN